MEQEEEQEEEEGGEGGEGGDHPDITGQTVTPAQSHCHTGRHTSQLPAAPTNYYNIAVH